MNSRLLPAIATVAISSWSSLQANPGQDFCQSIGRRVKADCEAKPERVLVVVEDGVMQNEGCACEVVKGAIVGASAGARLVGEIVFTAVSKAPGAATTIAECALAAAPDASAEIRSALRTALGDKGAPAASERDGAGDAAGGKGPVAKGGGGKGPVPVGKSPTGNAVDRSWTDANREEDQDWGLSPVAIGGVYLVYPSSSGRGKSAGEVACECPDKDGKVRRPHPPHRVVIPPVTQGDSNDCPSAVPPK